MYDCLIYTAHSFIVKMHQKQFGGRHRPDPLGERINERTARHPKSAPINGIKFFDHSW